MHSYQIVQKKLSSAALTRAKKNKALRRDIGVALEIVDQTTLDYIRANRINGPLTTHAVVQLIQDYEGLSVKDILIDEKAAVASTV